MLWTLMELTHLWVIILPLPRYILTLPNGTHYIKTIRYYPLKVFLFSSEFMFSEIFAQPNPKTFSNIGKKNVLPKDAQIDWPLWTRGKSMISICVLSNQMFVPASTFIGLDQEDCCGCCGHENCGKRCAVGRPALGGKWSLRRSCEFCASLLVVLPSLDAVFYTGRAPWDCRLCLLCHCGCVGLRGRTEMHGCQWPVELHLCPHRGRVSDCTLEGCTFLSTTCIQW